MTPTKTKQKNYCTGCVNTIREDINFFFLYEVKVISITKINHVMTETAKMHRDGTSNKDKYLQL